MRNFWIIAGFFAFFPLAGNTQIVTEPSGNNGTIISHVPDAVLIRGPYLQVPTDSGITLRWRTDMAVNSIVEYGTSAGHLDRKIQVDNPVTEHIVKIGNLEKNTRYYYSVSYYNETRKKNIRLQGDQDNSLLTLPEAGVPGDYRVGLFGDPGSLSTLQHQVRDQFVKYVDGKDLNALVILGDIAYDHGLDAEYQAKFFNVYKDMLKKYALFTVPGNHDYHDDDAKYAYRSPSTIEYFQDFSMPVNGESGGTPSRNPAYYSVDIGNMHLLCLDSFGAQDSTFLRDTTGAQVQWLKKDLEENKNRDWVIVCTHFPPYSMGSHNSDGQYRLYKIRENLLPILERYGVDLFIAGHSHLYERSRLMKGHYGKEATFDSTLYDLATSSGRYDGSPNSCPYIKAGTNQGTVYVVNGGSAELGGVQKAFPHNAMYYSDATYGGANLLEVRGNRLDLKWICQDGVIRDQFTMMKKVGTQNEIHLKKGQSVTLSASFTGDYRWNNKQTTRSITVTPSRNTTYTVRDSLNCIKETFRVEVSR